MSDQSQQTTEQAKNPICPNCGQPISRDWTECNLCGQQLTEIGGLY